jgi:glycerophosphodiester phosphodiesterase
MVACANGHANIAELLLQAGSKQETCDARGWAALEHAVFRGHHLIAELFKPHQPSTGPHGPASAVRAIQKMHHPVCEAGDKFLVVYLGSTQGGHNRPTIQLGDFISNCSDTFHHGCPLELQVSVLGTPSATEIIQLPLLNDQSQRPLIFRVKHDMPLQILLKVYRCEVGPKVLVSSGISLLDQENVLGDKHESLIRERTIYMMNNEGLGFTGTVLLSYLVIKPYLGLEKADVSGDLRRKDGLVRVIGHRGMSISYSILLQPFF